MIADHKKTPYFTTLKKSSRRTDENEIEIVKTHNLTFGQFFRRSWRKRSRRRTKREFGNRSLRFASFGRFLVSGKMIHLLSESFGHSRSFDFRTFHCLLYGRNLSFKFFLFFQKTADVIEQVRARLDDIIVYF